MIIGPGSPVIFVGPDDNEPVYSSGLTVGALYFVATIEKFKGRVCYMCDGRVAYSLKDRPGRWRCYCVCAFKSLGGTEEVTRELEMAL